MIPHKINTDLEVAPDWLKKEVSEKIESRPLREHAYAHKQVFDTEDCFVHSISGARYC